MRKTPLKQDGKRTVSDYVKEIGYKKGADELAFFTEKDGHYYDIDEPLLLILKLKETTKNSYL